MCEGYKKQWLTPQGAWPSAVAEGHVSKHPDKVFPAVVWLLEELQTFFQALQLQPQVSKVPSLKSVVHKLDETFEYEIYIQPFFQAFIQIYASKLQALKSFFWDKQV